MAEIRQAPPACRFCGEPLRDTFVDLGATPLCQKFVAPDRLHEQEPFYPLHALICRACLLVQLEPIVTPEELFDEYAYFSSYSDSWVAHAARYCAEAVERFALGPSSRIVEIAANDGYLLEHFVARGLRVLGIEPAANVARAALDRGIPMEVRYFGRGTAAEIHGRDGPADLVVANNVLAHVPDLNDFVAGIRELLGPRGAATLEFPHLLTLIDECQFDTIYHEHFSYFSFLTAEAVFAAHGLAVFDVAQLPTHGGSLRLYVQHAQGGAHAVSARVAALRETERARGLDRLESYMGFAPRVQAVKERLVAFLCDAKASGRQVAGYGAPGKGNTLLNYCGISSDLVAFTVDRNRYKHGLYTPGSRIPISSPDRLFETRPDFVLILPWNLRDEIAAQMAGIREWGGRFVVPIPALEIF